MPLEWLLQEKLKKGENSMGKDNDAMLSYLEDDERFADLFNQVYFGGQQIVRAEDLSEASEVYPARLEGKKGQRIRDVKKRLRSGKELKILGVEVQGEINYLMPWRLMDYDCREYERQIRQRQRWNRAEEKNRAQNASASRGTENEMDGIPLDDDIGESVSVYMNDNTRESICRNGDRSRNIHVQAGADKGKSIYENAGERLGGFRKSDRIAPVYTICLYHGTERWDGPKSLKDMMDFGEASSEEQELWKRYFVDYPMRLVCANEPMDCAGMTTSLREVLRLLPYRKDRKMLDKLLQEDPIYKNLDMETARTVSVLMGVEKFMGQEEKYKEGEGYNMCQAVREMMEDSRAEGKKEGREVGRKEGRKEGKEEGEQRAYTLTAVLLKENRLEDLKRIGSDVKYREQLYCEFRL